MSSKNIINPKSEGEHINHGFKPHKIGSVLERLCKERGMKMLDLVRRAGKDDSVAYKLKDRFTLSVDEMMLYSKLLNYNLFDEYYPDITTAPGSEEEKFEQLESYQKEAADLRAQNEKLVETIKAREAQIETLERVIVLIKAG